MEDIIWSAATITMIVLTWSISRTIKWHFEKLNETVINVGIALGLSKEDALLLVEKAKEEY